MSKSAKTATAQSTEKPEKTKTVTKKITKRVVEIPEMRRIRHVHFVGIGGACLLYTSPSPRDQRGSRMPSSA